MSAPAFGALAPGWLDRMVISATSSLPDNWFGLRLAILLRRIVTMRLPEDGGIDVIRWGLRMRLHPRHNGCEKGALFTPQMYEASERDALFSAIDAARAEGRRFSFVDVGANVGLFSFLVAAYAGIDADVLAIEPESENLARMDFNVANNPGLPIRTIPVALGATEGTVVLDVDRRDKGGTRTRPIAEASPTSTVLRCRPLLPVLRQAGVSHIDALKIDVEGAEDSILLPFFKEAPRPLWPKLIIVEDTHRLWREDLFGALDTFGYTTAKRTKLNVIMRLGENIR